MNHYAPFIAAVVCLLTSVPAAAQVQDRPAREGGAGVYRGGQGAPPAPSATATNQTLALTVSMLGVYDDRSRSEQQPGGEPALQPLKTRSAGLLDASARYRVGNVRRWLQAQGSGFITAHNSERPLAGMEALMNAFTTIGRRTRVNVSQSFRDAPFLTLQSLSDVGSSGNLGTLPDSDPSLAVNRQRSRLLSSTASITRDWTPRQSTSVAFNYARTDYAEGALGFDSNAQSVIVQHSRQFSRTTSVRAAYHASRSQFVGDGNPESVSQSATGGFDYTRRLSRTRQVGFAVSGGASNVETISAEPGTPARWTPSGSARITADIGRSWVVNTEYSRSSSVLQQGAVRTFFSDAVSLSTGGLIGRRLDASLIGSFTQGRTPIGQGDGGRYESISVMAQVRWAISASTAAVVGYRLFDARILGVDLPDSFPARSRVSGIRVGLSFWVPVISPRGRANAPVG